MRQAVAGIRKRGNAAHADVQMYASHDLCKPHRLCMYLLSHIKCQCNPSSRSQVTGNDAHMSTCRCAPPTTCIKLIASELLAKSEFRAKALEIRKSSARARTRICTLPTYCVKRITYGYMTTQEISAQSGSIRCRDSNRGVHVCTCRCKYIPHNLCKYP